MVLLIILIFGLSTFKLGLISDRSVDRLGFTHCDMYILFHCVKSLHSIPLVVLMFMHLILF